MAPRGVTQSANANSNAGIHTVVNAYDNNMAALSTLTAPAIVAIVGYALLVLVVMLPFNMYTYDEKTNTYVKTPYRFWDRLLIAVLLLFPFFLGVYTVNCMMVGQCQVWSWVVAIATLLWACIVVIAAIHRRAFKLDDVVNY